MPSIVEARKELQKLIDLYNKYKYDKQFMNNEKQACQSLIVPLIKKVLYWDTEDPSEFKTEESKSGKRIDYVIYNQGISQFIVEAKAPSKNIFNNSQFYKQALEYGYSKNHDFAILTNFRQIVILACKINVRVVGEAEIARIDLVDISNEDLALLLSFEKNYWVSSGKNNNLFAKLANRKSSIPVDDRLLDDMKHWREMLLTNIRKKQEFHDEVMQIEEEIQKFIDRLVFICFCEDKELEEPELKSLLHEKRGRFNLKSGYLLGKIKELFERYRRVYNSDLFDLSDCDKFKIDDDKLMIVFEDLREPKGRIAYDFKSIEADILGKVYENFIGHIQAGKKRFKEKEDIGKRKKGGIYYTPKYIVDYIVNNTVREYIKGKSFEEINKVRILDPACGSGSFLLRAFDVLVEESSKRLKRELNYKEKRDLMLNCIYGVDVDNRAIRIVRLNLSLKMAERGESLPVLGDNIRQGNSLIDDKEIVGWDAFVWEDEFKEIIDDGGFDVVVGNPPYLFAREKIKDKKKEFFSRTYETSEYQLNTYLLFIEKSIKLLNHNGLLGFIIPDAWLKVESAKKLRKFILEKTTLKKIVHIRGKTFPGVGVESSIFILENVKSSSKTQICINFMKLEYSKFSQSDWLMNKNYEIDLFSTNEGKKILDKVSIGSKDLDEISIIKAGLQAYETGKGKPKQTKEDVKKRPYDYSYKFDKDTYGYLRGKDVRRYSLIWENQWLRYGEWLAAPRSFKLFSSPRILIREIPAKPPHAIVATYLKETYLNNRSIINIIQKTEDFNLRYILAVLNSKLISFYHMNKSVKAQRDLFPKITLNDLRTFPIKILASKEQENIVELSDKILSLHKQLNETNNSELKKKIKKEIEKVDNQIDELVYKLYGITEEEKKIIEESLQ